ncbi:MAG: hypothetical protein Q4P13_00310 [Psychrobacter sp.]|nr:hypothetical protein [Psychrobacter sp.]
MKLNHKGRYNQRLIALAPSITSAFLLSAALVALTSCQSESIALAASEMRVSKSVEASQSAVSQPTSNQTAVSPSSDKVQTTINQQAQQQVTQIANQIKQSLLTNNYQAITPYIHPTKGVRFSMYAYVQKDKDKVFTPAQFEQYLKESRIKFTWGEKDGTGDLYITTLPDYLKHWASDGLDKVDSDSISYNAFQSLGNSLNNLKKAYPDSDFVEFYFPGTDEYSGMDWRALRLVFEAYQGRNYLVAIINDQWTI